MDAFVDGVLFGLGFIFCVVIGALIAYVRWKEAFRD
jgi:hypothetical protein